MSTLLQFANAGKNLTFSSDGTVSAVPVGAPAATPPTKGTWVTDATATNSIRYTLAGAAAIDVPVTYGATTTNQLVITVTAQPAATATLQGRILVEDNHRLCYYLVDDQGDDVQTPLVFYVFGALKIDPATNKLTVDLGAGRTLTITGTAGHNPTALTTGSGQHVIDYLNFAARTINKLAGGADLACDADIHILGMWDLKNNEIVFTADAGIGGPASGIDIVVVGKLRGIAAGFELSTIGGATKVVFVIEGRIAGKDSTGNWSLQLGYANKKLTASLQGKLVQKVGDNVFTIEGKLSVAGGGGAAFTLDIDLKAEYVMQNGRIHIAVKGSSGTGYSLELGGDLKIGAWQATFNFTVGPAGSATFSVDIGNVSAGPLHTEMKLFLDKHGKVFTGNLSLKLQFVNGYLVP